MASSGEDKAQLAVFLQPRGEDQQLVLQEFKDELSMRMVAHKKLLRHRRSQEKQRQRNTM